MKPDFIFWVALAAYAFHILEEYNYDWKTWAQSILKLDVSWNSFYITNAVILIFGFSCAEVGWAHPTFSLMFPALMLVNAVFYHILPYIRSKRKFSPGMFTAIFLFLPLGIISYNIAINTGVHLKSLLIAGICGTLAMFFPIFLLKTKNLDFFKP